MERAGRIATLIFVGALLACAPAWAAPQSNNQQKCINKMNKDGIKVEAQQGKENVECVKRKNNDELGSSLSGAQAEICITADAKSKVFKKKGKTTADDGKFCQAPNVPDFGYTGSANVNSEAQQAELDLIHDVFGSPIDSGLYSKNPNVFEAVCQRNVIDRVEKLIQTMGREFVKCKKNALKVAKLPYLTGAASASDLNACVDDALTPNSVQADTKGKIAKRYQNLLDAIVKQCETVSPVSDHSFPGVCNGLTNTNLQSCLNERARCRFCLMANAMDGLTVDCDAFDDGVSNTSCP
jgi:hypothetical protein